MRINNKDSVRFGCKRAGKTSANFSPRSANMTSKCPAIYVKTFGCQMNVRDSEVICGLLKKEGYVITDAPEKADVLLFNTCSVRQHAEDKVWSEVGKYKLGVRSQESGARKLRTPNSELRTKPIIGVIGCMAQNYKDEIFKRAPQVDFVVGPTDIDKIPQIIKKIKNVQRTTHSAQLFETKIWETDGNIRPEEIYHTGFYEDKNHAYVVISEGCSNYCSYCVVPYVRGRLHHRNYQDILGEIEGAVGKGITRITLLGQNVNAYVSNLKIKNQKSKLQIKIQNLNTEANFSDLLKKVNKVKGLKEFSFITSHPKDTSIDLFNAMAELDKLKKYLHLPVQSGSDRILNLMNRGYTKDFYLDLINNYRKIVKGAVLTTDIIVGFPSETEADFQQTYDLVREIEFDAAYIFKYSLRLNTQAASLADDVAKEEKERRHRMILELQKKISKEKR